MQNFADIDRDTGKETATGTDREKEIKKKKKFSEKEKRDSQRNGTAKVIARVKEKAAPGPKAGGGAVFVPFAEGKFYFNHFRRGVYVAKIPRLVRPWGAHTSDRCHW